MLKKQARIPLRLTAVRVRQLQLFTVMAEVGSISEAARRVHVTQPTATEMLKELERSFSMQLVTRDRTGIALTPQGERVAARVSVALRELQWAAAEAESAMPAREVVRVGFVPTSLFGHLPRALHRFTAEHPEVRLTLKEFNVPTCALALIDGEVDLALTMNHPLLAAAAGPDKMRVLRVAEDPLVAFLSTAMGTGVDVAALKPQDLSRLRWALPMTESFVRAVFDDWFFRKGISPPETVIELSPMTAAIELLEVMPCVALLPQHLSQSPRYAHLRPVPSEVFSVSTTLVAACKDTQVARPEVRSLMRMLAA